MILAARQLQKSYGIDVILEKIRKNVRKPRLSGSMARVKQRSSAY